MLACRPGDRVEHPHGAGDLAGVGDDVGARGRRATLPHTTLTPARGSSRRESTAGSSVMSLASAKVRSSVRCGRDGVPAAAGQPDLELVGGAGDRAPRGARPGRRRGSGRSAGAKIRSTLVERAERRSAGRRHRASPPRPAGTAAARAPGSSPAACTSASARPAPSSAVVCTSWPQAWATPGTVLLPRGRSVRSSTGARRGRRAAPPAARTSPRSASEARCAGAGELPAGLLEAVGHQVGGALLVPGELGVGVQVAAQVDEVVGVLVDHRIDQSERIVRVDMSRRG